MSGRVRACLTLPLQEEGDDKDDGRHCRAGEGEVPQDLLERWLVTGAAATQIHGSCAEVCRSCRKCVQQPSSEKAYDGYQERLCYAGVVHRFPPFSYTSVPLPISAGQYIAK